FNFAYRRAPTTNPITGAPQSTQIDEPNHNGSLVPQPHISAGPSPILAPQRSSSPTQITSPNELNSNGWKPWNNNNEPSSPTNEDSTSQKVLDTNNDTAERDSSKIAGSEVKNIISNQINGNVDSGGNWADQTQHEST
ncbi:15758_t:CDS:2, partial [Funneliformis caledonium]